MRSIIHFKFCGDINIRYNGILHVISCCSYIVYYKGIFFSVELLWSPCVKSPDCKCNSVFQDYFVFSVSFFVTIWSLGSVYQFLQKILLGF